jgi:hypothetical protein
MSAARRPVRQAKHDVDVQARLAVVADRDVPDGAQTSHCSSTAISL